MIAWRIEGSITVGHFTYIRVWLGETSSPQVAKKKKLIT